MKKRIVIIAAMAMILGLSGLVYASNPDVLKGLAARDAVHIQNNDENDDTEGTLDDENENNASENAQYVLGLVEQMQEDKIEAKGDIAEAKEAVLAARKALLDEKKAGGDTEDELTDLEEAIEAYKDAKAGMQTSVGELKKGDVQNNGVDNSDKEKHTNNGHHETQE